MNIQPDYRHIANDQAEFFKHYCRFFKDMTYDTVSFEVCITEILPDGGALMGGKPGPIQNRTDFEAYPWDDSPKLYWNRAESRFDALVKTLPEGMKLLVESVTGFLKSVKIWSVWNICLLCKVMTWNFIPN
ncbi:MAG: hypothetical protein A2X48_12935 [Lentisphaerae bacterium GWF2_49_21]|nr:MAG: hypothetical protein A2X48_12935 [Lentisphaerae bacterium GWF2_49_21]